ncbi:DUF6507 family protein [Promicromonospora sp. NPDC057488]|uniref:DUF6507 family protein n=1 Tax=Promicromonospora sp. NPDC057488 TaxID=3346147 RepID=UPI003673347C
MTRYRIAPDLADKTLQRASRHIDALHSAAQQVAARSDGTGVSGDPVVVRAVAGFYVLRERRIRDLAARATAAVDGAKQAVRAYDGADEKMATEQRRAGDGTA